MHSRYTGKTFSKRLLHQLSVLFQADYLLARGRDAKRTWVRTSLVGVNGYSVPGDTITSQLL